MATATEPTALQRQHRQTSTPKGIRARNAALCSTELALNQIISKNPKGPSRITPVHKICLLCRKSHQTSTMLHSWRKPLSKLIFQQPSPLERRNLSKTASEVVVPASTQQQRCVGVTLQQRHTGATQAATQSHSSGAMRSEHHPSPSPNAMRSERWRTPQRQRQAEAQQAPIIQM